MWSSINEGSLWHNFIIQGFEHLAIQSKKEKDGRTVIRFSRAVITDPRPIILGEIVRFEVKVVLSLEVLFSTISIQQEACCSSEKT